MNARELSPQALRRRTIRSFVVLIVAFLIGFSAWFGARRAEPLEDDTIAAPFRRVLEWNGRIWHALFSPDRLSPGKAPPPGKRPRFNGGIGLDQPIDLAKWSMEVVPGDGTKSQFLNMAEIRALPRIDTATEFKCIEGWSENISYAGVRFSDFLKAYKLGTHADGTSYRYVGLETPDGEYYVSIDMESMLHPQTVLAYEMNGHELDPPNGAPLRLIIPVKYGIKHLKRIGKIFFSDERPPDYWAEQGYDWFAGL